MFSCMATALTMRSFSFLPLLNSKTTSGSAIPFTWLIRLAVHQSPVSTNWRVLSKLFGFFGPDYRPISREWLDVEVQPQSPANRALWMVLTLWRKKKDKYVRQVILESDHRLLNETQVVLGELVLPALAPASSSAPLAIFDNGFKLESGGVPERAQAGETLSIPFTWRSDVSGEADHAAVSASWP